MREKPPLVEFPPATQRPRRLRAHPALRSLVRETRLAADQLVMPLFVRKGKRVLESIDAMPGQFRYSTDTLVEECQALATVGVRAVLLFGLPESKDEGATRAANPKGIVQESVRAIKHALPELIVITDVCLCAYTSHGHCGVLKRSAQKGKVEIDEPATLKRLAEIALSHAEAGADIVAPSDMMDGNVAAIRHGLDAAGLSGLPIMSYSVKFASAMYGPFRDAAASAPSFGDRRGYQMDFANADEALREAKLDIAQGADILMVKPALSYTDLIWRIKKELNFPVAAYNVSGEYAMVKAAAARDWIDERAAWQEQLLCLARAGADVLITYWAKDAARWLGKS